MIPLIGPIVGTLGLLICPAKLGWYVLAFWVLEPAIVLAPVALFFAAYKYLRKMRS